MYYWSTPSLIGIVPSAALGRATTIAITTSARTSTTGTPTRASSSTTRRAVVVVTASTIIVSTSSSESSSSCSRHIYIPSNVNFDLNQWAKNELLSLNVYTGVDRLLLLLYEDFKKLYKKSIPFPPSLPHSVVCHTQNSQFFSLVINYTNISVSSS